MPALEDSLTQNEKDMLVEAVDIRRGCPPNSGQWSDDDWCELRHRLDEIFGGVQLAERIVDAVFDELGHVPPAAMRGAVRAVETLLDTLRK